MFKPIIGINPYYFEYDDSFWNGTKEKYFRSVWLAGGVPVTLHHLSSGGTAEDIVGSIDGFLLVGGPDIPNHIYGGKHSELLNEDVMHPNREKFDRMVFLAAESFRKPVLGICVGFQHINIIYGGTLFEDISAQMKGAIDHGDPNGEITNHIVRLDKNSLTAKVMGTPKPIVNSAHHQGVNKLGDGLRIVGRSSDGLPEAIENVKDSGKFIAVQWHPETLQQNKEQKNLFGWLVEEAKNRKTG